MDLNIFSSTDDNNKDAEFSFNASLQRLEKIIEEIENPDLDLKDAIKKYEEAAKLVKVCKSQLKEAEVTIQEIMITIDDEN